LAASGGCCKRITLSGTCLAIGNRRFLYCPRYHLRRLDSPHRCRHTRRQGGTMRRQGSRSAALVLLLAGGVALLARCAQKTEETSTTVDSTLSGSLSSDVPPQGPTPSQEYTPPPAASPSPAPAPVTHKTTKPKSPSSPAPTHE